jgi:zinc protease
VAFWRLLAPRLAAWRAPAGAAPRKNLATVSAATQPRVYLVDRPGAEQSTIVAANVAPPRSDADHIRFLVLDALLGGNFSARLNMNLREDKHWSYGASTRIVDTIGPGIFRAGAGVQTDKTAESMVEIRKELRDVLAARKPTPAELKFAQDTIVIALPGSNETSTEIAGSYEEILTYGLKDSYWNDLVGDVGALTIADLDAASARLIHPDGLTWVVVGDLAKVEKAIRALGFGDVTVLDADGNVVSRP